MSETAPATTVNEVQVPRLGVTVLGDGTAMFGVWAPVAETIEVVLDGDPTNRHALEHLSDGFWQGAAPAVDGQRYTLVIDGELELPDPCSRAQPEGVRGPSEIVGPFWPRPLAAPLDLSRLVIYELHVGTFTDEGTLAAAAQRLHEVVEVGASAVELMPLATFPGNRGWGYDGLYTWAPHPVYGGPEGLAAFVDAAHEVGLGVIVDVVYNHIGPGNEALRAFGPYFTERGDPTAWGDALDYRVRGVREWAIQNAEMWVTDYGVDGLRLDAVGAIADDSQEHVCSELARRIHERRPEVLVISERGEPDLTPIESWGHDAMWIDSLHHELHVALTGERDGYYALHTGTMSAIARELLRPQRDRIVVAAQNHDQVGNRALGDRLEPAQLRVAEAVVLFSESVPLLFQGEEYAEPRPFQFFTDHIDPAIAEATREGRQREFAETIGKAEHVPDPQDVATFEVSKLGRVGQGDPAFVRRLVDLHRTLPHDLHVDANDAERTLDLTRGDTRLRVDFERLTCELLEP